MRRLLFRALMFTSQQFLTIFADAIAKELAGQQPFTSNDKVNQLRMAAHSFRDSASHLAKMRSA